MRNPFLLLTLLFCAILTACSPPPEEPPQTAPVIALPETTPKNPITVEPYEMEGPGARDLVYNDRWEFYVEDSGETEFPGMAFLVCRDLDAGNEWVIDALEYGEPFSSYWETVWLYPFTGLLGRDGFIFSHESGSAWLGFDFYAVADAGPERIATCWNTTFTADLDGDGQLELLSNYHNMGYLDVTWADTDGTIYTFSMNKTAQNYIGVGDNWVYLLLQEESGNVEARWKTSPDGSSPYQTRTLDLAVLWKWEMARSEVQDILPLCTTEDGRLISIHLRECRSRSGVYPLSDNHYRVEEIQVYDGNTPIQTISPDDLSYDGDHLFEGLFVIRGYDGAPYAPDIRDFNFDGFNDLGLLGSNGFGQNAPYCYFLWDPVAGRLSTEFFILFAPLEIDEENRWLIEPVSGGEPSRCYRFDASGHPVLVDTE